MGTKILGPIFYQGHLSGQRSAVLENFLDDLNLYDCQRLYFQQDGARAHTYHCTTNLLERLFGLQWIGVNGPVRWPPRSPDITPLVFFLWGHVKMNFIKCNSRH